jgi:hypothetical protein
MLSAGGAGAGLQNTRHMRSAARMAGRFGNGMANTGTHEPGGPDRLSAPRFEPRVVVRFVGGKANRCNA